MAKNDKMTQTTPPEAVISIIGVGMTLTGDCETDGAIRIEGTVKGNVRAGKAVVIGKEGLVDGNIYTQDAVISGRVLGSVHAQSRLELQSTSQITGEIDARRMHLEEGATVQGPVSVGEAQPEPQPAVSTGKDAVTEGTPEGGVGGQGIPAESPSGGVTHDRVSGVSASPAVDASPGSVETSEPDVPSTGGAGHPLPRHQPPPPARGGTRPT